MDGLENYLKSRLIEFEVLDDKHILIDDKTYLVVNKDSKENIFNQDFEFSAADIDDEIDGWIYYFCGRNQIQRFLQNLF